MVIFMLVGTLAGIAGGVLTSMSGVPTPTAIVTGVGCGITVAAFLMAVAQFLKN
jgi:hypothetical protein